jgi:hypothetical protein
MESNIAWPHSIRLTYEDFGVILGVRTAGSSEGIYTFGVSCGGRNAHRTACYRATAYGHSVALVENTPTETVQTCLVEGSVSAQSDNQSLIRAPAAVSAFA